MVTVLFYLVTKEVGHIADPDLVRPSRLELRNQIPVDRESVLRIRRPRLPRQWCDEHPVLAENLEHPVSADLDAGVPQLIAYAPMNLSAAKPRLLLALLPDQ